MRHAPRSARSNACPNELTWPMARFTMHEQVQYCKRCIEVIVQQGLGGAVGRCPTCSSLISIKDGVITGGEHVATCRMCCQDKIIGEQQQSCTIAANEKRACHETEN